jgi:hypothetical protein
MAADPGRGARSHMLSFLKRLWPREQRGVMVRYVVPLTGALLFGAVSFYLDNFAPNALQASVHWKVFQAVVLAVLGGVATNAFVFVYGINSLVDDLRRSYVKVPWKANVGALRSGEDLIRLTETFVEVVEEACRVNTDPRVAKLAVRALEEELAEQAKNIRNDGRLLFIRYVPQSTGSAESRFAADSGRPGYGIIEGCCREQDTLIATDFANSNFWWLSREFARYFLEFNLQILRGGTTIKRVFGINHPRWNEDENGTKREVIQLLSRIQGCEIHTIDYADFEQNTPYRVQPIDCMLLTRRTGDDREPRPVCGIEWAIDHLGGTEAVYHVFGRGRLEMIQGNFARIMSSASLGSSLSLVNGEKTLRAERPADYNYVISEFSKIIQSARHRVPGP